VKPCSTRRHPTNVQAVSRFVKCKQSPFPRFQIAAPALTWARPSGLTRANTVEGNSRASRESGLLCSHSHGASWGPRRRLRLLSVVAPLLALCSCECRVLLSCAFACDLLIFLHGESIVSNVLFRVNPISHRQDDATGAAPSRGDTGGGNLSCSYSHGEPVVSDVLFLFVRTTPQAPVRARAIQEGEIYRVHMHTGNISSLTFRFSLSRRRHGSRSG